MFHTTSLGLWLVAALLPFSLTKNPFYLLLAIAAVSLDYVILCRNSATAKSWSALLQIGLALALLSVVFNVLFVSVGATRLATLPMLRWTLGDVTIQVGGAVTLESLVYGIAQSLGLIGVLIALGTFNSLANHYELLRSAPRLFHQSAIVLSIGITFVPQVMLAQAEIREAQALRGHRFRAVRDLPPLFIALVAEGLERSITLAESMSARGFGRAEGSPQSATTSNALIASGLFAIICGILFMNYFSDSGAGFVIAALGGAILLIALARIARGARYSRYKRTRWRRVDSFVAAASFIAIFILAGAWFADRSALIFYPYPRVTFPPFDPILAAALLLLGVPALTAFARQPSRDD